jgi:cell shape-determining protein MreD
MIVNAINWKGVPCLSSQLISLDYVAYYVKLAFKHLEFDKVFNQCQFALISIICTNISHSGFYIDFITKTFSIDKNIFVKRLITSVYIKDKQLY